MKKWLKRIRGALVMGLTWGLIWAPAGVLIGMVVDPDGAMDEPWIAIGAYPGFLCGVVFSAVLIIAARHRRFEELSLSRFAAWGALAGVLVALLPIAAAVADTGRAPWLLGGVLIGALTVLGAASAAGSLALARKAEQRALGGASAGFDDLTRTPTSASCSSPRRSVPPRPSPAR